VIATNGGTANLNVEGGGVCVNALEGGGSIQ